LFSNKFYSQRFFTLPFDILQGKNELPMNKDDDEDEQEEGTRDEV